MAGVPRRRKRHDPDRDREREEAEAHRKGVKGHLARLQIVHALAVGKCSRIIKNVHASNFGPLLAREVLVADVLVPYLRFDC